MYKKNGAKTWYARYRIYRSRVKRLFIFDERVYRRTVEDSLLNNPDKLWKFAKEHTRRSGQGISLKSDSGYLSDPIGVANIFESHFKDSCSSDVLADSAFLNNHRYSDVFMINRVTVSELTDAIKN